MSATTIKDALSRWERENRQSALEATEVGLQFQWLPIERMDNTLSLLTKCEILSLSTNMIEKITGLQGMKSLRILSLARNDIKSLSGLEVVAGTLEQLWMSYNLLETTKGIEGLQKLKVLYLSHNLIKFWADWSRLSELPNLVEVNFVENPLNENMEEEYWRDQAINRVPQLRTLDGETVIPAHLRKAAAEVEAPKE